MLIPISFLAIRLAENFIHPVAFTRDGPQMAGSQFFTFCVCLAAMLAARLRALPGRAGRASGSTRACASCGRLLRVSTEEKYVAAAYLVVFAIVLVYVVIIAPKLPRLEREVGELAELAQRARAAMAELLFWPALLAYGEAAVAYAGERAAPGLAGRLATWGVRLGWLAPDRAARRRRLRAPTASRGRPGPARSTSSSGSSSAPT